MTSTAPPAPASANPGLLERLKAQRADRIAQSAPPPAQAAPDTAQQPPPAPQPPKLPSPPLQPFQTPQPEAPLLSFPDVNVRDAAQAHLGDDDYSAEYLHDFSHSYLHEPLAPSLQPAFDVAHPEQKPYLPPHASTASPLAHAYHPPSQPFVRRRDSPTHFADVECAIEPEHIPYSPWTLPPFPQQEVGRVPSRLSERTLLNEAAPVAIAAPAPPAIASPVPPAPPPNTAQLDPRSPPSAKEVGSVAEEPEDTWERRARREKRERRALLDWERAQREEDRRNRPPSASSRSSTHPSPRKYRTDVNETSHDPPPSSLPNHPLESSADPAPTPEPVLAEGWLLLPPRHRPFTDGLLRFPEQWGPVYVLLTPVTLHLGGMQGEQNEVNLPLVSVVRVVRLARFNQPTFEPFRVDFASGEYLHLAGTQALDAAFWLLKIDNAHTGAYRRPASIPGEVASALSISPSRLSLRHDRTSSRSSSRTTLHPLPHEQPSAAADPRPTAEKTMPSVKSDAWMRDFHQAVPTHAYVEELPAHAGPDDWGAIDDELRRTAQAAAPVVPGATGWPARPPPEESPPPSRSRSGIEVRQSDLDALGFILDKLRDESASLNAQAAAKQEFKLQLSRDELQRLEEQIRARLERERRPASPSEQKVLDKVEWLLHLNDVQLRKYAYAMLRDGSSSASGSTAKAFQKELDLMTTIERELESLQREAQALPRDDRSSRRSSNRSRRGASRSLARKPSAISRFSANTSENIPSPTIQIQQRRAPTPLKSPRPSPMPHAQSIQRELQDIRRDSPVLHEATTTINETITQEYSPQDDSRRSSAAERRRRLQELFLDVEYLFQQQQECIASSVNQQERLRHSLGKMLNLLQRDSEYRSETLSSLVEHLYDLTTRSLKPPLPRQDFPPPAHVVPSSSQTTITTSSSPSSSSSFAAPVPPKNEMHLLPSNGRMAPRLIPRALAPPQAPPKVAAQTANGRAAVGPGEKGGTAAGTSGKRPVFGVDAALEPAHHLHRWRAGPEAAKAAREVVTIAKSDAPALPVASVPASKLNHPPQAVKRDERVEKALETLGRAEMKQEKAGAKPALTGEGAAKKAIAVWELLDAQKRVREEKGRAKKPGAGRGLGLRR